MDFVLLHGTALGPEGWERLAESLRRRGHRAVIVDFPVDRPEQLADILTRSA